MPSVDIDDSKPMSRLFNPTSADNEQIIDHVRVHVESNEKSKIPAAIPTSNRAKRQLPDEPTSYYGRPYQMAQPPYSRYIEPEHEYKPQVHVNIETERKRNNIEERPKRSFATEHITVPNGAENILGVVHQKRVEEEIEQTSDKRNKILKLVKRQMYDEPMQRFWEPRATIRGNKAMKNPILQLLRAAAGQKTQRILGLNSKAFDIFPGPLPEDRNIALNNNLGRVTNEAPTNRYPGVNQQILSSFRRPTPTYGRQMQQQQQYIRNESPLSMYPQQIQEQQQQLEQRRQLEQREQLLQQRAFAPRSSHQGYFPRIRHQVPQQDMTSMEDYSQGFARAFSNFAPFTPHQQQPQQQQQSYQESTALKEMYSRGNEEMMQQQQQQRQQQQMFMRPSSSSYNSNNMMYQPEQIQQERAQMRDIPSRPYQEASAQRRQMASQYQEEIPQYQESSYQQEAPISMGSAAFPQETTASQYRGMSRYPSFEQPGYAQGFERTIQSKQTKVSATAPLPEMKFNEQIGKLLEATSSQMDPSVSSASSQSAITSSSPVQETASPVEDGRQMIEGVGSDIGLSHYSSQSAMYGGEGMSHGLMMDHAEPFIQHQMPRPVYQPHFATTPSYQPFPYYRRFGHSPMISSHIPTAPLQQHHRQEDDDFDDEKPEVHVHIQTEKSHISKPNEVTATTTKTSKTKKS